MKVRHMCTSYQIGDIIIESADERVWVNILTIFRKYDNIEDAIAEIKEKNLGTVYKTTIL